MLYLALFPDLLGSLHADHVMTHRLCPINPGTTHVECSWLIPREVEDAVHQWSP